MHEYSVTRSLVDICEKEAVAHRIKRVSKIRIKIGRFTGFSPAAIGFYFEYLKPATRCAKARLIFDEIPITVRCAQCRHQGVIDEPVFLCPRCGGEEIEITSGREFYVDSIEGDS